AVDKHFFCNGHAAERMSAPDDKVCIFARFNAAHPVSNADELRGSDCDCAESLIFWHAFTHCNTCMEREPLGATEVIALNGNLDAAFCQDPGILKADISHFHLDLAQEGRPYGATHAFLSKYVCDEIPLGSMFDDEVQVKLFSDSHCGKDIIGPVSMDSGFDLALYHPGKGFHLEVYLYVILFIFSPFNIIARLDMFLL